MSITKKDILGWCDDLHTLKGCVSQFQSSINSIIARAPSKHQFELLEKDLESRNPNQPLTEKAKSLLYTPQAKVGIRLKELYNDDRLPLLALINKVNFKSQNADKWVSYLLDYSPPKDIGKEEFNLIKKGVVRRIEPTYPGSEYPPTLPPIDPVNGQQILNKVLTDKSFRQPSDYLESANADDFSQRHNAKYALRGQKILECCVMDLVDEKFPTLHEDDLYLLSYKLVSPTILTKFALGYNLVSELNYSVTMNGLEIESKLKILSNLFLAYIAGLVPSKRDKHPHIPSEFTYNYEEIKAWLRKLYKPIMEEFHSKHNPMEIFYKNELEFLFGKDEIIYSEIENEFSIVIEVKLGDDVLGVGTSSSKEEAINKAAEQAFRNKEKIDKILLERQEIERERELERKQNLNNQEEEYEPTFESDSPSHKVDSESTTPTITNATTIPPQQKSYLPPPPPPGANAYAPPLPPGRTPNAATMGQSTPQPQPYTIQPAFAPLNAFAKKNLHELLQSKRLVPVYKYSRNNSEHTVTVVVDGLVLAQATDVHKKVAGQRAAMLALGNNEILRILFEKKDQETKLEAEKETSLTPENEPSTATPTIIPSSIPQAPPSLPKSPSFAAPGLPNIPNVPRFQ
ncbi:hypothetical protein CAAN3_10S05248 [[Candida] anglica]